MLPSDSPAIDKPPRTPQETDMTTTHPAAAVRTTPYASPRAATLPRVLALAFSGVMTLGMLASVNSLATSEPTPELLARVNTPSHT
jgi:hypothetical protein